MRFVAARNVTDGPVVVDHLGRMLGGHEWGAVCPDMTHVQTAAASHRLALVENIPDDRNGDGSPSPARQAHADAERLTKKAEAWRGLSPVGQHLRAGGAGLAHEHLGGDELVYLLTVAGPEPSTPNPEALVAPEPDPEEASA